MTAFRYMEQPSPLFRLNRWEHPAGQHHWHAWFWCPGCQDTHAIGDTWTFNGDWSRPTFSPSFLTWIDANPKAMSEPFISGFRCHSHIVDGEIRYCPDCSHALAGKTVPMEPIDPHLG